MNPAVMTPRGFAESILYSYAQILFSNRLWFGAVLLAATFVYPPSGLLGLAGVVLSNALARLMRFSPDRVRSGFYGFNGILIGAAYGYFLNLTPALIALFPVFVVITFFVAAALENYFAAAFNLPGLSLPFMLSLYITLIFLRNYGLVALSPPALADPLWLFAWPAPLRQYLHAMALILFQPHALAGVMIALGLLIFSRVLFVLSVLGFAVNWFVVQLLLPQQATALMALTGLNAVLVAIALGGSLVIPSRKSLALALLAVLMTVIFTGFFVRLLGSTSLPVMVLPFNVIVMGTIYSLKFRQQSGGLVLLYFAPGSPEENHDYHHTTQARLEKLRHLLFDLPFSGEWTVSQGHNGASTHRGPWRYAWDFVVTGETGQTYSGLGTRLEDFYCYRLPVSAPLDSEVVKVVNSVPNNPVGEVDIARNWGNTIILKHADGLYSSLSHLEPGSARVKEGQHVKRGEILALCGSSGRSPEPHLHLQFQTTDKLGAATLDYPLGYYVSRQADGVALHSSEVPPEGARLQNLMPHRALREAFGLTLGRRLAFECRWGDAPPVTETWEVKVDVYNTLYIESSAGAWADLFINDRMFYLTAFRGHRHSALYYFYLSAVQVPLGYQRGLVWQDQLPLGRVFRSPLRPLAELVLLLGQPIRAGVRLQFADGGHSGGGPVITSELAIRGEGLFSGVRETAQGRLSIAPDGSIASLEYAQPGQPRFRARQLVEREAAAEPVLTVSEGVAVS